VEVSSHLHALPTLNPAPNEQETVLSSLDEQKIVGGLFCDLQKAFDCVNHNILLVKLEFYGVSGTTNKLLQSYLSNRYQRTVIKDNLSNETLSEWELVKHGVLQGLILGPLLFLIYINDLSRSISNLANTVLFHYIKQKSR
jgi:hypothetical protein